MELPDAPEGYAYNMKKNPPTLVKKREKVSKRTDALFKDKKRGV